MTSRFGRRLLSSLPQIHALTQKPPEPSRVRDVIATPRASSSLVRVKGWLKTVRVQKSVGFAELSDGSSLRGLQLVFGDPADAKGLQTGCAVDVVGSVRESPAGSSQAVEVAPTAMTVVGGCDGSYPLQKKRHSLEFMREINHLRSRGNLGGAVLRVRNAASMAVHNFFQREGFVQVHTPVLTTADCEGGGEAFGVYTSEGPSAEFFGTEAYLTVSGQLHAEAFAMSHTNVYTFGPTFRAENSNTTRHLAEFLMVEPEMAFAGLPEIVDVSERFVKSVVSEVERALPEDMEFFSRHVDPGRAARVEACLRGDFVRMTYLEASVELEKAHRKKKFRTSPDWDAGLSSEQEMWLTEQLCGGVPVFVTDYPDAIKPFYMKENARGDFGERTVACMDLLVPRVGELVGGSAREDDLETLERRMLDRQVSTEKLEWYLDLRRFGSAPHAGFGLGFERLVQYLTGIENIRDTIPVPRAPKLCRQ